MQTEPESLSSTGCAARRVVVRALWDGIQTFDLFGLPMHLQLSRGKPDSTVHSVLIRVSCFYPVTFLDGIGFILTHFWMYGAA